MMKEQLGLGARVRLARRQIDPLCDAIEARTTKLACDRCHEPTEQLHAEGSYDDKVRGRFCYDCSGIVGRENRAIEWAQKAVAEYRRVRGEFIQVYGLSRGIDEWRWCSQRRQLVINAWGARKLLRNSAI